MIGTTIDRNATSSSTNASASTNADHVRDAVSHLVGEVDVLGGVAGHRGPDAGNPAERLRDEHVAELADRVPARGVVAEAGERQSQRERPAVGAGGPTANGGWATPLARLRALPGGSTASRIAARSPDGQVATTTAGEDVLGNSLRDLRRQLRLAGRGERIRARLGHVHTRAPAPRARPAARPTDRRPAPGGGARGRPARPRSAIRRRSRSCGRNGIRPRSMRGPRSCSSAGRTVTEPATAHATTTIVPAAIPLKMSEPTTNWPAIAIATVVPAISTERPEVRDVRSSASRVDAPRRAAPRASGRRRTARSRRRPPSRSAARPS